MPPPMRGSALRYTDILRVRNRLTNNNADQMVGIYCICMWAMLLAAYHIILVNKQLYYGICSLREYLAKVNLVGSGEY